MIATILYCFSQIERSNQPEPWPARAASLTKPSEMKLNNCFLTGPEPCDGVEPGSRGGDMIVFPGCEVCSREGGRGDISNNHQTGGGPLCVLPAPSTEPLLVGIVRTLRT